jgi:hypothetical protein
MATLNAKILTAGKLVLSNALLGITPAKIHSFKCGDTFGFTPDSNDTAPRGNLVFQTDAASISTSRLSDDTVRYVCSITEQHGPFIVGNLVLYIQDELGNILPFISVVLPVPIQKLNSNPIVTPSGYEVPGTRLSFNVELKHSDEVIIATVNVVTPTYGFLPSFETEAEVPIGAALNYKNFVISHHTVVKRPVLGTLDGNAIRWGIPFTQQINDPNFGHLDGGDDSQPHHYYDGIEIIFGNFYTTPELNYTYPVYGGGSYTENLVAVLGGATYTMTGLVQVNYVPS